MKKVIFIVSMSLFSYAMFGQTSFGLKSGVNLANLEGDISGNSMLPKFYFGGYANVQLADKLQLQTELLYQGMGAKLDLQGDYINNGNTYSQEGKGRIRMDYFSIPVLAKYYFTSGFYGEFGPQFSIAISQKYEYDTTIKINNQYTYAAGTINLNDEKAYGGGVSSFDLALGFGLGYQFNNGLNIGARYNYGINEVVDQLSPKFKAKNSVLMFGIGYTFKNNNNRE